MAVECNEFFSIYKKEILLLPEFTPLVSPPCPSIRPDPSGELFPALPMVSRVSIFDSPSTSSYD